uniref:Uncharacterized protein n=1 Tax=Eutreptiella gymnastica TaxID=73025 RepID=A0A7S1JH21_9EUGL|mmetsp:Transcript_9739/g.17155  ORF Transcript_9739/g.17155 Transcript_9739/m.17155 type:complete len:185 (+) Transcript_9739:185-739(+)
MREAVFPVSPHTSGQSENLSTCPETFPDTRQKEQTSQQLMTIHMKSYTHTHTHTHTDARTHTYTDTYTRYNKVREGKWTRGQAAIGPNNRLSCSACTGARAARWCRQRFKVSYSISTGQSSIQSGQEGQVGHAGAYVLPRWPCSTAPLCKFTNLPQTVTSLAVSLPAPNSIQATVAAQSDLGCI